jgi:AAA domain
MSISGRPCAGRTSLPFGRCCDNDFYALTTLYADLDNDVSATASASCRSRGCPPTDVVITGRYPFVRAQVLWRLDNPIREADVCQQQILALAQALDGDGSVFNPGRVLRLGGSIAWPMKEGRVIERTEFMDFSDGRPKAYMPEAIAKAFPITRPTFVQSGAEQAPAAKLESSAASKLLIGTPGVSVDDCMSAIRAGDHWHDNLLRVVGHWIAREWSDFEILAAAESMTLPGYTDDQTRREVSQMIAGGRRKWGKENPTHDVEESFQKSAFDLMEWTADRYAGEAKLIRWLCRGTIPLGVPVLVAAMGGLGKSYLALDLALHTAAGVAGLEQPRLIFGGRLEGEGTAVLITAEDSFDAIHRRLNRIDPEARRLRHPQRLIVLPTSSVGGAQPLITADRRKVMRAPFLSAFKEQLASFHDLRLVVFDPLQAFVAADVNADPAAAQFLWSTMSELAATTGATVLLTRHMRKEGMSRIVDADDAREAIRGTTALVDGARLVYALWKLDRDTAKPICDQLEMLNASMGKDC